MIRQIMLAILAISFSNIAHADAEVAIGGSANARHELSANLQDSNNETPDEIDFSGLRFRLDFTARVSPQIEVFVQPQLSKIAGGNEAGQSSGNFNHPGLRVYAAYLHYTLDDSWNLFVGRQALAYGQHRVIGTVGWRHDARAFDAIRLRTTFGDASWIDVFGLQIKEDNAGPYGGDTSLGADHGVLGLYCHIDELAYLNAELYALYSMNQQDGDEEFMTLGALTKGSYGDLDVALEVTGQTAHKSYQLDVEIGYAFRSTRLFFAYGQAHEDYQQMYPTAHKFLGHADLFGRRNRS